MGFLLLLKSQGIGFLLGSIIGATGMYLADRFTDQRRRQEANRAQRQKFQTAVRQMPLLMVELRNDLLEPDLKLVREFILAKRSWGFGALPKILIFYFDDHPELESQV